MKLTKRDLISKEVSKKTPTSRPDPIGTPDLAETRERRPEGLGLSVKDGWNFGLGFWLCSVVIIGSLGCVIAMGLAVLSGGLLGGLL